MFKERRLSERGVASREKIGDFERAAVWRGADSRKVVSRESVSVCVSVCARVYTCVCERGCETGRFERKRDVVSIYI